MQKLDFDIGSILYIVITLVAVLIGVLGKKKKPGGPAGSSGSKTQPGFLENLEKMLNMGQESPQVSSYQDFDEDDTVEGEVEVVGDSRSEPVKEAGRRPGIMDDYERIMQRYNQDADSLYSPEADNMDQPLEVIELDEDSGADFFEMIRKFDARTAIVYSAIINPIDY